jgi:hypothetical protein
MLQIKLTFGTQISIFKLTFNLFNSRFSFIALFDDRFMINTNRNNVNVKSLKYLINDNDLTKI